MFDRFTRDEVSSWVWWPATMILLVLLVLTFPGENRAIDERRADAAVRAWSLATGTIAPALDGAPAEPIGGEASSVLDAAVSEHVLAEPWTDTVRIWGADGTLLWSSERSDPVGSAGGLNDDDLTRALADITRADQVVNDRDLDGRPSDTTFSAYAPFTLGGDIAVAQLEVDEATLLGDVRGDWLGYRIVFGLAAIVTLALAIGSMREPVARIGAGVPFYRTSLPRGTDVIEVDRRIELERSGTNARDRVAHMDARLRESEALRLRAEGDLQRALSQLATQPRRPARSVIPRSEPDVPVTASPTVDAPAIAATAGQRSVPPTVDRPPLPAAEAPRAPAAEAPHAAPAAAGGNAADGLTLVPPLEGQTRSAEAAPARRRAARPDPPQPIPTEPDPAHASRGADVPADDAEPVATPRPAPRKRTAGRSADPRSSERAHPSRRSPAAASTWQPTSETSEGRGNGSTPDDDVVVVPGPEPMPSASALTPSAPMPVAQPPVVLPASETVEPADEGAREVLERLVEPIAAAVVPAADPSVLRAKLARTAALKKPGSRHDERLAEDPTEG